MLNPSIFREYDIRGLVARDLHTPAVRAISRAIAATAVYKNISRMVIGYDARISSPAIADELCEVLNNAGIEVLNVGLCPTPLLYYALTTMDVQGGVMITASHNPGEFNGLKVAFSKETIHGREIQDLYVLAKEFYDKVPAQAESGGGSGAAAGADNKVNADDACGKTTQLDLNEEYCNYLVENFHSLPPAGEGKRLKVVIDAGNGTGGILGPAVFKRINCDVTELYCEIDGTFPNHHPDPTVPENIKDLIAKVLEEKADVGIGFDGDTDRIGLVDEKGNIVYGDKLMILLSRDILKRNPGATIIFEVKCSQLLEDDIAAHGGNPIMYKTGHSLIKAKMKETGALLAGEMSGHIFIKENYFGYDDAIYAALRVAKILKESDRSLSELLSDLPETVVTPELRVESTDETKFHIVEELKNKVRGKFNVNEVDGVRIKFDKGWGLVRASNTQPVLVLRFEADTEENLKRYQQIVNDLLVP